MSAPKMKDIIQNGVVIGQMLHTGDLDADALALRDWLKERGMWKPKSKAHQIYAAAGGFLKTATLLHARMQQRNTDPDWRPEEMIPFVVNAAFSVELFLKAIGEATGRASRGHDLLKLYRDLPPAGRQAVDAASARYAIEWSPNGGLPFADLLRTIAKAFEKWRYAWELDAGAGTVNFQDAIAVLYVVHRVASELIFPRWTPGSTAGSGSR